MTRVTLLCVAALLLAPDPSGLGAQVRLPVQPPIRQLNVPIRERADSQPVPAAYRPPPGMCRIWLEGVPPGQQPAPTDCASAVRNRPSNGRVIFGDDYVKSRRNGRGKDKRPVADSDGRSASRRPGPEEATAMLLFTDASRVHGPSVDDEPAGEATLLFAPEAVQPPARKPSTTTPDGRTAGGRGGQTRPDRRDSADDARRRRQDDWDRRRGVRRDGDRDARDRDARDRDARDRDGRDRDVRDGNGRDRDSRDAYDRDGYARGYGAPYDSRYLPGRANGTCLDRDGDGWCDDYRTGGGYCVDRDGDGRCDDYPGLASAPYSSALPPMRAASDVARGRGSEAALRWLGTAEVTVRTSDVRRSGTPYRAMWTDASTGELLQVWTDRDGDGIADRVEIYRNGRIAKTIGR